MKSITDKKHFVGVDISKDTIALALISDGATIGFHDFTLPNTLNGFKSIDSWLKKHKVDIELCLFCMEHTGTYGLMLFAWLSNQCIDYCVEPGYQIKRSLGMARGKNDIVDARRIADYAQSNLKKLKLFKLSSALIMNLKQLLTFRDQMVRMKTMLKNSLHAHRQIEEITDENLVTRQLEQMIQNYQNVINETENKIKTIVQSDPEVSKSFNLATSVRGIGLVIATMMIVTTNNFTSFDNGRKYACYAGIAPFEYTSGTTIKVKSKVSHLGNRNIKTLLSNGANSAIKSDPELRGYYNRKRAEGKDHKLIINAISCKLVNRVFAVIKRQQPYVTTYQQFF